MRPNDNQIERLINLIGIHKNILFGSYECSFGPLRREAEWNNIMVECNALGSGQQQKSVQQWKKVDVCILFIIKMHTTLFFISR